MVRFLYFDFVLAFCLSIFIGFGIVGSWFKDGKSILKNISYL